MITVLELLVVILVACSRTHSMAYLVTATDLKELASAKNSLSEV